VKIAIFGQSNIGEAELAQFLRDAVLATGQTCLDGTDLQLYDQHYVQRWFCENEPDLVLIATYGRPQRSSHELLVSTIGYSSVVKSALLTAKGLRVFSFFASNSFFILRKLCEFYRAENGVDFSAVIERDGLRLTQAAVLFIQDVLAKEANPESEKSTQQSGEVRDQVVPERPSDQQLGTPPVALLEVPVPAAKAEASDDLCAECAPPAGASAAGALHDNSGAV
jgi:hypothetical protein